MSVCSHVETGPVQNGPSSRGAARHAADLANLREVFLHRIGETDLPGLLELHEHHRRERLRDRSDAIDGVPVGDLVPRDVGEAVALRPHEVTTGDDADGDAADAVLRELRGGQ
jgi:hypothetical protein